MNNTALPYVLARFVDHDPRSRNFALDEPTTEEFASLSSIRHTRYVPVFDQGQVGSCTANAAAGVLGTGTAYATIGHTVLNGDPSYDEQFALALYSEEEIALGYGPYPPNDQGGTGLAIAKVLQKRGLIQGYKHAFTLNAALAALATQPVIVGVNWYDSMFTPTADGRVILSGSLAGGHEFVLDELDVQNHRVWFTNSWSLNWGINGRAWMSWSDLGILLSQQGDCTAFVVAAPVPTPTPTPVPVPTPTPTPVPVGPTVEELTTLVKNTITSLESILTNLKTLVP